MNINRKQILKAFLSDIADISDKEYQRRIWIRAEGPECDDFTEIVCRYSNAAEAIFEKYEEYNLTDIQLSVLKKFHEEFKTFWIDNDLPQIFIDTPEWTKITLMAKEVLDAFDYHQNKNPTVEAFLEEVVGISDKEYQKRVWIRGEGPECDDFDEAVCRYSNIADCIFEEYKECAISDFQMTLIKKFHEEFKTFWMDNDLPQIFIDTPEWTKITLMAKEVLNAFNYHQENESENKIE